MSNKAEDSATRVSRKQLLNTNGMVEFRIAPYGGRMAVRTDDVVGVVEREPEQEDLPGGADVIMLNGDKVSRVSLLDTYAAVIQELYR